MAENKRKIKVQASFVTKRYEMAPPNAEKLKAKMTGASYPDFWAVRGVSFKAFEGETIAVVGTNGSGKSTLMKMLAGAVQPTSGAIKVNGEVSLIAINAGLRGNMSGRENIRLKGLMMGMSNAEIDQKMNDIIAFSELGDFIDQQVKSYSSGMKSKLGFSISVHADPDILIIDEALSVGDATFNRKSLEKIKEFQARGKTIFFVSHDLKQVREMADKVLWMHFGQIRMFGDMQDVMNDYTQFVNDYKALTLEAQRDYRDDLREVQENFTLDQLYQAQADSESDPKRLKKLKQAIYRQPKLRKMTTLEKWFVVILTALTCLVGDMSMLNLSATQVIEHPKVLITDWRPKHLAKLDKKEAKRQHHQVKKAEKIQHKERD